MNNFMLNGITLEDVITEMEQEWQEYWELTYDSEIVHYKDEMEAEYYTDFLSERGFEEDRIVQILRRYN